MGDFLLELLFLFAEAFFEALFEFALEVAFDFDFTQTPETQAISPTTQATMLAMLLDALHIDSVDLVANDSGGLVSQLFVAKYPQRVRTLLLTNCDVDENSPPPQFLPFITEAKKGTFVDRFLIPQLNDKQLARSAKGIMSCGQFRVSWATITLHANSDPSFGYACLQQVAGSVWAGGSCA